MNRLMIYPGAIPLETDLLQTNKNVMIALAKLSGAIFGTAGYINGLSVGPNSPAALNVIVQPGELYAMANIDGTAYSSLAADTTHSILKQGILLDAATLPTPAPGTAGQSINYLIQAAFSEVDSGAVVLPYYNASNPATAYSGPANSGATNNTNRAGTVVLSAKAGIAAATGSQVTPAADAGYTGLCVVTVANGQATVVAGNISVVTSAPYMGNAALLNALNAFMVSPTAPTPALGDNSTKLATMAALYAGLYSGKGAQTFSAGGTFTVPAGVTKVYLTGSGGGGGGGAANNTNGAGGGGAAASCIDLAIAVTPGAAIAVTIGTSGSGATSLGGTGGAGSSTSFGALVSLGGGGGGTAGGAGGTGGTFAGTGTGLASSGQSGQQYSPQNIVFNGGAGGSCLVGAGGVAGGSGTSNHSGGDTVGYGAGGGGAGTTVGSNGSVGQLIVKW